VAKVEDEDGRGEKREQKERSRRERSAIFLDRGGRRSSRLIPDLGDPPRLPRRRSLHSLTVSFARARARARENGPPIISVRVRDGGSAPVALRIRDAPSPFSSSFPFLPRVPFFSSPFSSFPARISSSFRAGEEPRRRRRNVHGERGDN